MGYAGARIVRSALYHPAEVTGFSASHEDIEARGYALADDLVASTLVFGGTLCMCAAGIILLNRDAIYEHGCEPVASVVAQLSVLIFSAAFVVQVACFARIDELEALFGDSACVGAGSGGSRAEEKAASSCRSSEHFPRNPGRPVPARHLDDDAS